VCNFLAPRVFSIMQALNKSQRCLRSAFVIFHLSVLQTSWCQILESIYNVLRAKATSVFNCLFSFDATVLATAGRNFTKSAPKESLRCYSLMVVGLPHENRCPQKVSGAEKIRLRHFRTAATRRRNYRKTQITATIYTGYPHIHVWWNWVRRHLSYRGFISCTFGHGM